MMFPGRSIFECSVAHRFEIMSKNGKKGILNPVDNSCVLPAEYDNIFTYVPGVYVLHKEGKIGAVSEEGDKAIFIVPCDFDVMERIGHDLIFCNDKVSEYFNSLTKTVRSFVDIVAEPPFLYCKDEKYQYILFGELGKEIYKKEYNSYSESCFCFCGYSNMGPVFFDTRYSMYIFPSDEGYKAYPELYNHPIVINGRNVANIVESYEGVGVIDSFGNKIADNRHESITVELLITTADHSGTESKVIRCFDGSFKRGGMFNPDDAWAH